METDKDKMNEGNVDIAKEGERIKKGFFSRMSFPKKIIFVIVVLLLIALLALGITFLVIRGLGEASLNQGSKGSPIPEEYETVQYNGKEYKYNDKLINILCMGIDNKKETLSYISEHINEEKYQSRIRGGSADFLMLVTIDREKKKVSLTSVNRLCMTTLQMYDDWEEGYVPVQGQLCLQHAYGTGLEDSCELQVHATSGLLYNIPINGYVSLNISGIKALNHVVGGIELTALDNIPPKSTSGKEDYGIGDSMSNIKGKKVLLNDKQAYAYINYRDTHSEDSNENRTARHKQYLKALITKIKTLTKQDLTFPMKVKDALEDYMLTDLDFNELLYLVTEVSGYDIDLDNVSTIKGRQFVEKLFNELAFTVDQDALREMIITNYYKPIF